MTTRRQRKEIEAREAAEREILERRERRLRWVAIGLGSVLTVTGGAITLWKHLPDGASAKRDPASVEGQGADQAQKGDKPGKSLDQVKQELEDTAYKQRKSKEWAWAEEGNVEKVMEEYRATDGRSSDAREKRVSLLNVLGRAAQPRASWPAAFNDQKANAEVDFLAGILAASGGKPGPEPVAAVNDLAAVAKAMPELAPKAEKALLAYYAAEERPGPRGECLLALAAIHSPEALKVAEVAARGSDSAMARTAVYALAEYAQTPSFGEKARSALRGIAKSNAALRPLAVKLLANYGDRKVASMVPPLLREGASPAEVEAGAFAVGRLKLRQYKDLLIERSTIDDPVVRHQISESIQQLNR